MTDDERLAALFRDAAGTELPPSAFDHDRVVTTSRRITARRRSAVLGGAMALLVVAGVGVAAALPSGSGDAASTAAAPAAAPAPEVLAESSEPSDGARDSAEAQSALPDFDGTPLGPGTTECADRQDPQLRAYVEEVLPEVAGAVEGATTTECRPGGERGVNLEVDDAGTAGLLTVQYLPPGEAPGPVSGTTAQAPTASGGTVVVSAGGAGPDAPVPFEGRLDSVAAFLAPRL